MPLFYNIEWYGFIKDGTIKYFYLRDSLQNIIAIIDSTGNLVVRYNYTAYGLCTITYNSEGIAEINPFRYKGYYYDNESGMYYCNSRYYVPEWCRWLTPDSPSFLQPESLNGMNLFAYCGNDPVNRIDPNGNFPFLIAAILVASTVIGATIGGIKAKKKMENTGNYSADTPSLEILKGIAIGATIGLAAGGAAIALGAVVKGAVWGMVLGKSLSTAMFLGTTATKAFAIGALAFDFTAFVAAPLIGVKMEGIEIDAPSNPISKPGPTAPGYAMSRDLLNHY